MGMRHGTHGRENEKTDIGNSGTELTSIRLALVCASCEP